jgi:hypothetical protein
MSDIAVHSGMFNGFGVFSTNQKLWNLSLNKFTFIWLRLQCFN